MPELKRRSKRGRRAADQQPWWRNFSTAMALAGLFVTLAFNTVGTWQGAKSAEEGKTATSLGLLTTLNGATTDAIAAINNTSAAEHACDDVTVGILKARDETVILRALDHYDYLAFLLAGKHVTLEEAKTYWQREMVEAYWLAEKFIDPGVLKVDFPYIARFYRESPKRLRPSC